MISEYTSSKAALTTTSLKPLLGAPFELPSAGSSFNSVPYPRTPSLYHGWNGYGHHYGYYPTVWVNDGVCVVEGLLRGHHWGHIGNLPGDCRPSGREIFNMNNHQYTSRVDVLSNGDIHWITGGHSHGWLSLTGIVFVTNAGPKTGLPFNNGYTNYGHSYEGPYYSKINNECILGGLIGGGNGNNHVGTLPAGCRPRQGLLFNVNNHQCTMRLHVATDGRIHRETGHCHAWTSLAGVTFPASEATKTTLQLSNGWKGYGGYWGTPYYSLIKGECIVQGLISGNKWGWIATLPDACRPH